MIAVKNLPPAKAADEIITLFKEYGNEDYDGEPVSQTSHMIQCAMQAIDEGADNELVLGAFLHDVGHLLKHQQKTRSMGNYGVVNHEGVGADFLRSYGFEERIVATVAKHVDAKRYLVATDENYKKKLSPASQKTLEWQGGPMNNKEVKAFQQNPYYKDIIRVRLWDEGAKSTDADLLPLSYFRDMITEYFKSKALMDKPVELVVFDIAGTTVKDNGEIAKAFQQAMREYGYEIPAEKINPLMGYKKTEAIKKMLHEYEPAAEKITEDYITKIHEHFSTLMIAYYKTTDDLQPLPFAKDVFIYLKERNIKVGLDTGFPNEITDVIVERLGWLKQNVIDYVVSSNEVPAGRPQPFMIQKMMDEAGITDAKKVIKVGDTETDVNEGINAGCLYSIAVTTGAFTKEALEPYHPSFILNDLKELIDLFETNKLY